MASRARRRRRRRIVRMDRRMRRRSKKTKNDGSWFYEKFCMHDGIEIPLYYDLLMSKKYIYMIH
jgi:hypothetical protein